MNKAKYILNWIDQNFYMMMGVYCFISAMSLVLDLLVQILFMGQADYPYAFTAMCLKLIFCLICLKLFFKDKKVLIK